MKESEIKARERHRERKREWEGASNKFLAEMQNKYDSIPSVFRHICRPFEIWNNIISQRKKVRESEWEKERERERKKEREIESYR